MAKRVNHTTAALGPDELAGLVVLLAGLLVVAVWSGAQLAAVLGTGHVLGASVGRGLPALVRLSADPAHPASAWPAGVRSQVPGPWLYWPATLAAGAGEFVVGWWAAVRLVTYRIGSEHRTRLGVATEARLAKAGDLKTLIVRGPVSGRFILGRVGRRLVATENRQGAPATGRAFGRLAARQGDRTAVAVIGPQRSGKTATVISGILDWDGPAILSSVREDLYARTVARRRQLGTVYVFDPFNSLGPLDRGVVRVGWSPLHSARTVSGAMEAAGVLLEAAPLEGTTNATYWSKKGEALLWPILHAAAVGGRTMADVVRWLALQDGAQTDDDDNGDPAPGGEVRQILADVIGRGSRAESVQAQHALAHFDGFWALDTRTRSDIYSTSQTLVQPWEDPFISFASSPPIGPTIDLRMLLDGRNTLYVVQPLKSTQRFSVVFGGLLGALLKDQAYQAAHHYQQPLPDLLFVVDEAGNTPLQWLPSVASTCAGIGVLLVTVWQSKAQIDAIYQRQSDPLLTNHGTKIFFAGISDESTLRYVSYLTGEEEVAQRSANADVHLAGHRRTIGEATTYRRLLPAELLRQVAPGEGLLIHGTLPPAHMAGRRYWDDPRLRVLAAGGGPAGEPWQLPAELAAALAADPTPPAEVLAHLPSYRAAVATGPLTPAPSPGDPVRPRPLGWTRAERRQGTA